MTSRIGRTLVGVGALAAALASIPAQAAVMTTVIPGFAAATEQEGGDSSPLGGDKYPWRFQMVYAESLLGDLQPGDIITGLTFRLDVTSRDGDATGGNNTDLPAQTIANYEIKLGMSAYAPGALSDVFAENHVAGDITTVRTGQLVINPGDFTGGAVAPAPNPFGAMIEFNAGTYAYAGGPLLIEIAHDSFTAPFVPGQGQPGRMVDDVATGVTGLAQQLFGKGFGATTATYGFEDQAMVVMLQFERADDFFRITRTAVPEPGGINLFGAALACLMGVTFAGRRQRNPTRSAAR